VTKPFVLAGAGGGGKGGGGGYVAREDPNTLRSKSTAKIIDVISEGPIRGFVNAEQSIYFNGAQLKDSTAHYNFRGVSLALMQGLPDQDPCPGFEAVESEVSVGQKVVVATPVIRSFTKPEATAVRVTVRIPSLYYSTDKGDLIGNAVKFAIEVRRTGSGTWLRPVEETISGKCTSAYDRNYRIELPMPGPNWDLRVVRISADSDTTRSQTDLVFASYTLIVDQLVAYADTAYVALAADAEIFGNQIPSRWYEIYGRIIQVPNNYYPENYDLTCPLLGTADLSPMATSGGAGVWVRSTETRFIGAVTDANAPWGLALGIGAQPAAVGTAWTIEQKTGAAPAAGESWTATMWVKRQADCGFYAYLWLAAGIGNCVVAKFNLNTGVVDTPVTNGTPNQTLVASQVTALGNGWYRCSARWQFSATHTDVKLGIYGSFGTAGSVTGEFRYGGVVFGKTSLPVHNFFSSPAANTVGKGLPSARYYDGVWDGGFKSEWTDNPAWVLHDILTNTRFGLGDRIVPSQVDKWVLYEAAKRNDQLVPDGFGGWEPRYTFNGWITDDDDAYRVVVAIAAAMHAMVFWTRGTISLSQDAPRDPVMLVTNANVVEGDFQYESSALKARHSAIYTQWNDPTLNYRVGTDVYEEDGLIQKFGLRKADIRPLGVTQRGLARRHGRYIAFTEANESKVIAYRAGLDHIAIMPGDVVSVLDRDLVGVRNGGRLVAATTGSVTLDAPTELEVGRNYTIRVVMPDGTLQERPVVNPPNIYTVLSVSPTFSVAPAPNAIWQLVGTDLKPKSFRVISKVQVEPHLFEISAINYVPEKWDTIENDVAFAPDSWTGLPTGSLKPPTNVSYLDYIGSRGLAPLAGVAISWSPSPDPRTALYEVEISRPENGDIYETLEKTAGVTSVVENITDVIGPWRARVRASDVLGRKSSWAELVFVPAGFNFLPDDVLNFRAALNRGRIDLSWDPIAQHAAVRYDIRYSPVFIGATWTGSAVLAEQIDGTFLNVPAVAGTFLIKAISSVGRASAVAGTAVFSGDINVLNTVQVFTEEPAFAGTKTGLTVSASQLRRTSLATGVSSSGTYDFGLLDLGAKFRSRITYKTQTSGTLPGSVMANWQPLAVAEPLAGNVSDQWDGVLLVRTTDDNPSGSPTWSAYRPVGIEEIECRAMSFRWVLTDLDGYTNVATSNLEVTVDMDDRVIGARNVSIGVSGETLVFDPAFKAVPAIVVTPYGLGSTDRYVVDNQTASSFRVRLFDNGGTGIAGTIDWVAKGYGIEI
jgi:predicted phage tail protein